ncbi:hypothetical protein DFH27DRAFT_347670 [Peziza echinospora]|nr:hypothetical protein DFH27DRAFT_347670 [Peziza echinospora]
MVLPESKNRVGLGRALMKGKNIGSGKLGAKGTKGKKGELIKHYDQEVQKEFGSITEQAALDEFLSTAELADTDFTAEKLNIKVIHNDQINPYLLSREDESKALNKQKAHSKHLTVPRRPEWDATTTPYELDRAEKESFLQWRRGLAELQENKDLLMTPFERNLEMWRQLWRVIERSDLIVQIVDARNPLLFWCEDLDQYVKEVDPRKENLLLINKADMMTEKQRGAWADYFDKEGIQYTFFSAALAEEAIVEDDESEEVEESEEEEGSDEEELDEKAQKLALDDEDDEDVSDSEDEDAGVKLNPAAEEKAAVVTESKAPVAETSESIAADTTVEEIHDPRTRILTVEELEELFLKHAPPVKNDDPANPRKTTIGLVGYPNVGKSSTINALIKSKKVSVSSTPGKTKHFQTIHLSPAVILCDCPGLVFPNFATTKAELVCNGILPIDQLREFTGPAGLVARRIPQNFLEAVYGIKIEVRPHEEGGTGLPTAEELLMAYARARGFNKTGLGEPDEARAARYILKDYVNGKLLFCQPPPSDPPYDVHEFNHELFDEAHLPANRQWVNYSQTSAATTKDNNADDAEDNVGEDGVPELGQKSKSLDKQFFSARGTGGGTLKTPFQHTQMTNGKSLTGRKAAAAFAIENGLTKEEAQRALSSKKHYKGKRRFM